MYNNFEKPPQYDAQPDITLSAPVNITPMQPPMLNYQPQVQPPPPPSNVFYQPGQQQQPQIGFVQMQRPAQRGPIGIVQVGPIGAAYYQRSYLVWSILNAIFFFPYLFFWIPALICSLSSRSKASLNDMRSARQLANASLVLNILCTVLGVVGYIVISTVLPIVVFNRINLASSIISNSYSDCTYSYSLSYYMCDSYKSGCWYSYTYGYYMCSK